MELHVINSNSSGNAYYFKPYTGKGLLVEAGINLNTVKQYLQYNIACIEGCLITHEHGDHFKYASQYAKAGINLFGSQGTLKQLSGHRCNTLQAMHKYNIGAFNIIPFNVLHDAAEPFGYIIIHPEMGTAVFITDTANTQYRIPKLNHVIIEANYCENILNARTSAGKLEPFLANRVIGNHMSIQMTHKLLQQMDLTTVLNIVLIHLSNGNSNEHEFKASTERVTGKVTHIATKGKIINMAINKY